MAYNRLALVIVLLALLTTLISAELSGKQCCHNDCCSVKASCCSSCCHEGVNKCCGEDKDSTIQSPPQTLQPLVDTQELQHDVDILTNGVPEGYFDTPAATETVTLSPISQHEDRLENAGTLDDLLHNLRHVIREASQDGVSSSKCKCSTTYDPVCGENRHTYINQCEAQCDLVEVDYVGECDGQASKLPTNDDAEMFDSTHRKGNVDPAYSNLKWMVSHPLKASSTTTPPDDGTSSEILPQILTNSQQHAIVSFGRTLRKIRDTRGSVGWYMASILDNLELAVTDFVRDYVTFRPESLSLEKATEDAQATAVSAFIDFPVKDSDKLLDDDDHPLGFDSSVVGAPFKFPNPIVVKDPDATNIVLIIHGKIKTFVAEEEEELNQLLRQAEEAEETLAEAAFIQVDQLGLP